MNMKAENTSSRLNLLMSNRGLKQVDILTLAQPFCEKYDVKLGKNDLSQYVSGKVEPGQHKLSILGLCLNVSEAWLMGYDVPMEREKPTPVTESGPSVEFSNLMSQLTPEERKMIVSQIKGILSNRE